MLHVRLQLKSITRPPPRPRPRLRPPPHRQLDNHLLRLTRFRPRPTFDQATSLQGTPPTLPRLQVVHRWHRPATIRWMPSVAPVERQP